MKEYDRNHPPASHPPCSPRVPTILLRGILFFALVFAALTSTTARADPEIYGDDAFIPFDYSETGYQVDGGQSLTSVLFLDFGVTNLVVSPNLIVTPQFDLPDQKRRARVTLSQTTLTIPPSGDVLVEGLVHNFNETTNQWITLPVSETLSFVTRGTKLTTTYFDEITQVSTTGLGADSALTVGLWAGAEQMIHAVETITDVDQTTCADYQVKFNTQVAQADWDIATEQCIAELEVYFPILPGEEADEFIGHPGGIESWDEYVDELGRLGLYFDVDTTSDTFIRPLLASLIETSSGRVLDQRRTLFTLPEDPFGNPLLRSRTFVAPLDAGAHLQLTPTGLDAMEDTHEVTLPFPNFVNGNPQQSATAIEQSAQTGSTPDPMRFVLGDNDYFRLSNAPGTEFHGHLAFVEIRKQARKEFKKFVDDMLECSTKPNPLLAAACAANETAEHCVRTPPRARDFWVEVSALTTFYDPAHPEDALTVSHASDMDLEFGNDEIIADFFIDGIHGWLRGEIDPADVTIRYRKAPGDPCTVEPAPVVLSDFTQNAEDYENWFVCDAMEFEALQGRPATPLKFGFDNQGESFTTPYTSTPVTFFLSGLSADGGPGTCGESWMHDLMEQEVLGWAGVTGTVIAATWALPGGHEEAMNRLLAPMELGVEAVDVVPEFTDPYSVHPLERYSLLAEIGPSSADTLGIYADAVDGFYLPFMSKSEVEESLPYLVWFCPAGPNQACDGSADAHAGPFAAGFDLDGNQFDIGMTLSTAHINRALYAQARRPEYLGSPFAPRIVDIAESALLDQANAFGYYELADALTAAGGEFEISLVHKGAPYTRITDPRENLIYVMPNLQVEIRAIETDQTRTTVANILIDFIENNLSLEFGTGGQSRLAAAWTDLNIRAMTTQFLQDCYGEYVSEPSANPITMSCAQQLQVVVSSLVQAAIEDALLEIVTTLPTPQYFDVTGLSDWPLELTNPRTVKLNQSVNFLANFCATQGTDC